MVASYWDIAESASAQAGRPFKDQRQDEVCPSKPPCLFHLQVINEIIMLI